MDDITAIPGFSRYGITSDARLFNLVSGVQLSTVANRRGYHHTRLVNDKGQTKGVKRHRLVAMAHLEKNSPEDKYVNHKNLVPGDDWKDNLEWCTQKHNVKHWVENGEPRERVTLETMDVVDGSVTRYSSAGECSRALGLTKTSILDRVRRGAEYIWPEGKRYRIGHRQEPWSDVTVKVTGMSREVILKDLVTGKEIILEKLGDALCLIGYKLAAVWKWASDPEQPVVPGLFQIQFVDDFKPWRTVDDYVEELQQGMHIKVAIVINETGDQFEYYESATKCATSNGLKPTALNYRLKSKGQVVYSDSKRYCYYTDLTEVQKKTIRYEVLKYDREIWLTDMFNGHRKLPHESAK